jgi:protein-S-isoprenylcysteine O-methyltransferase Ste14
MTIIQILLLVLICCFYIAYFAKQVLLRKKGIATNRLAKGRKPRKTAAIERCLLIATYGTAAIQYASIFFSQYMLAFEMPATVRVAGLAVSAFGVLFFLLAITSMHDSWRAGVDESQKTTIVTSGVYRISRNPAFVGFDLLYIGTALTMPNVVMMCAALISIVLMHLQILQEEQYLPRAFGEEYLRYKAHTPHYLLFF